MIQNYSSDKARLWLIETREVHGCSRSYNQQDLAGSNQTSLVPEELQLAHRMVNQWRTRTQSDAASRSYHSDWNKVWLRRWCFCNYLNQRTYSHTTQVLVKVSSIHFVKWWCCVMFNTATSGRRYPNLSNHHHCSTTNIITNMVYLLPIFIFIFKVKNLSGILRPNKFRQELNAMYSHNHWTFQYLLWRITFSIIGSFLKQLRLQ